MNTHGIIICLKNSKNENTIKERTKNLIDNLYIQLEIKNPISSTIGCFNSHVKALKSAIKFMERNLEIKYIIIGEEDLFINYESKKYVNLINCLKNYNKNSNYILHLGGLPSFTNNINDIINNENNRSMLKARIYLATAYSVNYKIAIKLLKYLENSSRHIHCDAIIANSGINQYLVRGNIVNQLERYNSDNTYVNNFISTKIQSDILILFNEFSILFINNIYFYLFVLVYFSFLNKYLVVISETFIFFSNIIPKLIVDKKYNQYLSKNIFTFFELIKLLRFYTFCQM